MTFEAYKIAVKISLVNNVSAGLLAMSSHFSKANAQASELQSKLNKIKMLGMTGMAIGSAGVMGLGIIAKMIKPATEYAHQLNIINMAGWTQRDIANAVGDAWKNTGNVITTTATENLRTLLDLKNVLGTLPEARMALPIVSRIQGVLAASSETKISGNSKDLAYSMAKALDVIGAGTNRDTFEKQAEMMSKVIIATQGRVTPEMFKSLFVYSRQASTGLSDEYKYQLAPTLLQELAGAGGGGGGSRGLGPAQAAFYRFTNQGFINKKSLPELVSLGLVDASSAIKTTTSGTTVGAMAGASLAASNPFDWTMNVLVPAIRKKYGADLSNQDVIQHVGNLMRGNQNGAWLVGQFISKSVNFQRDQQNIKQTMSTANAYKSSLSNDPNTAFLALSAQWTNFKIAFMMGVIPVLIPALVKLTDMFNALSGWARENPTLTKGIAIGFIALASAMAIGGTILLVSAAFRGLGPALAFSAIGGVGGILSMAKALPLVAGGLALVGASVLSVAAGLAAAGIVGWGVGGLISDQLSDGTKNHIGRMGAKTMAFFGNKEAQNALDAESKYIAPTQSNKSGQGNVYLDGKKVGVVVAPHVTNTQAKSANRPQSGTTRHDGGMSLSPVGATGRF